MIKLWHAIQFNFQQTLFSRRIRSFLYNIISSIVTVQWSEIMFIIFPSDIFLFGKGFSMRHWAKWALSCLKSRHTKTCKFIKCFDVKRFYPIVSVMIIEKHSVFFRNIKMSLQTGDGFFHRHLYIPSIFRMVSSMKILLFRVSSIDLQKNWIEKVFFFS